MNNFHFSKILSPWVVSYSQKNLRNLHSESKESTNRKRRAEQETPKRAVPPIYMRSSDAPGRRTGSRSRASTTELYALSPHFGWIFIECNCWSRWSRKCNCWSWWAKECDWWEQSVQAIPWAKNAKPVASWAVWVTSIWKVLLWALVQGSQAVNDSLALGVNAPVLKGHLAKLNLSSIELTVLLYHLHRSARSCQY